MAVSVFDTGLALRGAFQAPPSSWRAARSPLRSAPSMVEYQCRSVCSPAKAIRPTVPSSRSSRSAGRSGWRAL